MPISDPTLRKVVRREFDIDSIAHQDANSVSTHASRDRRKDNVLAVLYLNLEKCVGLFIDDDAGQFN